jgi:hypothetical protein
MEAYQDAMEGSPRVEIGASRTTPGTMAAAVVSYFNSWAFQNLAAETRRTRKNILERFRERHGDKRIALLQADHVKSMLAAKAGTPQAANNFLSRSGRRIRAQNTQGEQLPSISFMCVPRSGSRRMPIQPGNTQGLYSHLPFRGIPNDANSSPWLQGNQGTRGGLSPLVGHP